MQAAVNLQDCFAGIITVIAIELMILGGETTRDIGVDGLPDSDAGGGTELRTDELVYHPHPSGGFYPAGCIWLR